MANLSTSDQFSWEHRAIISPDQQHSIMGHHDERTDYAWLSMSPIIPARWMNPQEIIPPGMPIDLWCVPVADIYTQDAYYQYPDWNCHIGIQQQDYHNLPHCNVESSRDKQAQECTPKEILTRGRQTSSNDVRFMIQQAPDVELGSSLPLLSASDPTSILAASPSTPSLAPSPKVRDFHCDYPNCNAAYTQKHHLKRHKFAHTGEKLYKCPHCPIAMSLKFNLKAHMISHLGRKEFPCAICLRRFERKGNRDAHETQVHGRSKVPCQFDGCTSILANMRSLKAHAKRHQEKTWIS